MAGFINSPLVNQQKNLHDIEKFFSRPNNTAIDIRDDGCLENIGARGLSLIQVTASVAAVVFSILAMIIMPIVTVFCQESVVARGWAKGFASMAGAHLFQIPASIVGIFAPSTLTNNFGMGEGLGMMLQGLQGMQQMARNQADAPDNAPGPRFQGHRPLFGGGLPGFQGQLPFGGGLPGFQGEEFFHSLGNLMQGQDA